ncbi:MAG: hypothetical protein DRJ49_03825 [Thermoprotei archaeon]|nr:MAG: hypothetical protein DRJ49_03825 [Thermoprotei archaeon]
MKKTYELHVNHNINVLRRISICFKSNIHPPTLYITSDIDQDRIVRIYPRNLRPSVTRKGMRWCIQPTPRYTPSNGEHLFYGMRIDTDMILRDPVIPSCKVEVMNSKRLLVELQYRYLNNCRLNLGPIDVPLKIVGGEFKCARPIRWTTRDLGTFTFLEIEGRANKLSIGILLEDEVSSNIAITLYAKVNVNILPIKFWLEHEDGRPASYNDENTVLCVLPDLLLT